VTRPPGPKYPSSDLEELTDDLIVSQQAAAHAPAPRVHVQDEARTIVVTQDPNVDLSDSSMTQQIRRYDPRRHEPTMVLRAQRHVQIPDSYRPYGMYSQPPPQKRTSYLIWMLWLVTGILAFALGGIVAWLTAGR
jgi:hypothetical protein